MAVWDNGPKPLLGANQKWVVIWQSQDTYDLMTLFHESFTAPVASDMTGFTLTD
jgi:hypothetical protein